MNTVPAAGVTIKMLISNSTRTVLDALLPDFEREHGHKVALDGSPAKIMMERIRGGESGDIAILGKSAIDELAAEGHVIPASRRAFAVSRVGVAVRAGAPTPDIASTEAFRRALLQAKSVCHTVHGASGMYVPVLFARLGIVDEMKLKTITRPGGYIAELVASGEAELALQQVAELLAVPGAALVGPIPAELQKTFATDAAIFAGAREAAAAEALLGYLLNPALAAVFEQKGLEQGAAAIRIPARAQAGK